MHTVCVDFGRITGRIKPMHAINNMPTLPHNTLHLYEKLTEAGIPYARMHDTGGAFGGAHYVDIENIFPDSDADENDPASYDFAFTDALFASMAECGIKPFYRLGCSIENNHKIRAYHIFPPKDNAKWARICEHIIRHYNEGWADGYEYGIEYWEIWCEPDNQPDRADNPMWRGSMEAYFELYHTAATHLKRCFPHLKIGGYSSCGFYAISDSDFSETAHSSSRVEYFIEFFLAFLSFIRERGTPLDFFSWHSYAGIAENVRYAAYAKEKLVQAGYGDAEVIFNEWNPGTGRRGEASDAAHIGGMMCAMQKTAADMSMYYDANLNSGYCGLFDPVHRGRVFKAYYAFLAWGRLYRMGYEAESRTEAPGVYSTAASDGKARAILLANTSGKPVTISLSCGGTWTAHAVDGEHEWEECEMDGSGFTLPPYALRLLESR